MQQKVSASVHEPKTRSDQQQKGPFGTGVGQAVAACVGVIGLLVFALGHLLSPVAAAIFCLVLGGMCIGVCAEVKLERKWRRLRSDEQGHVMVEFGLGYSFVLLLFAGTIGFGHLFYIYNSAQSAVRSAARYASLEVYDLPNGTAWKASVKNMAIYGTPAPQGPLDPIVFGWTPNNITVTANTNSGVPESVVVRAQFDVETPFINFTLSEPRATFPYLGQVASP